MRRTRLGTLLLLGTMSAAILLCTAGTALALLAPANLNVNGNYDPASSDLFSDGSAGINWYNQPLAIDTTPTLYADDADGDITVDSVWLQVGSGAETAITGNVPRTLNAEGTYHFRAQGLDESMVGYSGETTIGIDFTRPVSYASGIQVAYDVAADFTLMAGDLLSGPRAIVWSIDGGPDQALASPTLGTTAPMGAGVALSKPGAHTITWFAVDCAGNFEKPHTAVFWVNASGYTPVLSKPTVTTKGRNATIKGTVTPATSSKTVVLTVTRKVGSKFRPFTSYVVTVPRYTTSYSVTKRLSKAGTYQVKAAEDGGSSSYSKSFVIK